MNEWDATVVDTLGNTYLQRNAVQAASAAETAAARKETKYSALTQTHLFYPVAFETIGPVCSSGLEFLREIGRRLTLATSDPRETTFLMQRLSMVIQRFNAVCLADTFRSTS